MCVLIGLSPHDTEVISKAIRSYLNLEWQRKLDEKVGTSIPLVWAKEHPGMSPYFGLHTMPDIVANVPSQSNDYDCGLFVLRYMDFWTFTPPDLVNFCQQGRLKGKHLLCLYNLLLCHLLYRSVRSVHLGSIDSFGMLASGTYNSL